MTNEKPRPSFEDLDARLRDARNRTSKERRGGGFGRGRNNGLGLAFRLGVEIVAAVAIGVGIGWLLDEWLGTRPWLMVLFFFLGSAAGMMNVYRTMSGLGHGVGYQPAERSTEDQTPPDDTEE